MKFYFSECLDLSYFDAIKDDVCEQIALLKVKVSSLSHIQILVESILSESLRPWNKVVFYARMRERERKSRKERVSSLCLVRLVQTERSDFL